MIARTAPNDVVPEPYVGLRAYGRDDHDRFYGRAADAYSLSVQWRAHRLTMLYGPSGVGKTSLLHAGVLPRLNKESVDQLPVGRLSHGSPFPMAALSEGNPFTFALLSSWAPNEQASLLSELSVTEFLRRRGRRTDRYGDPMPTLLAIDQAEELFFDFPYRQSYREPFIEDLAEALDHDPDLRLLLSIREDYLARALAYEGKLGGEYSSMVALAPFTEETALEAVQGPVAGTGRVFAPGAAAQLVKDLRTIRLHTPEGTPSITVDTVEPILLQVVCARMWESLPPSVFTITHEHLQDVDRSLGDFLDRVLVFAADRHDIPLERLRQWLRETFVTDAGTRSSAYEGETQTAGMPNALVKTLIDGHVLKAEIRLGGRWCELQHDRLLQPVLRAGEPKVPRQAAGKGPQDAAALLRIAEQALADGQLRLAQRYAEQARRAAGERESHLRAEIESFLGNIAHTRGEWGVAEKCYREAAQSFERLGDTAAVGRLFTAVGRLVLQRGEIETAIGELRSAVARLPNDAAAQVELARALWLGGAPRAALPVLDGALAVHGDNPSALLARAQVHADLDQGEAALRDVNRLHGGVDQAVTATRALALAVTGRTQEAAAELGGLPAVGGQNVTAYLVARTLIILGERGRAWSVAQAATRPPLTDYQRERLAEVS